MAVTKDKKFFILLISRKKIGDHRAARLTDDGWRATRSLARAKKFKSRDEAEAACAGGCSRPSWLKCGPYNRRAEEMPEASVKFSKKPPTLWYGLTKIGNVVAEQTCLPFVTDHPTVLEKT